MLYHICSMDILLTCHSIRFSYDFDASYFIQLSKVFLLIFCINLYLYLANVWIHSNSAKGSRCFPSSKRFQVIFYFACVLWEFVSSLLINICVSFRHIVVLYKNHFYAVNVINNDGTFRSPLSIRSSLQMIVDKNGFAISFAFFVLN
jgi:succinate dehydrogenase/fumarate reductase cytochrome b subunit